MLTRHELASLTERLIDQLDAMGSDADLEPAGDELDGTGAEDEKPQANGVYQAFTMHA